LNIPDFCKRLLINDLPDFALVVMAPRLIADGKTR